MSEAEFALGCRKGDIAGAILLTARAHSHFLIDLLEQYTGGPRTKTQRVVWEALKAAEADVRPSVVDAGDEG